MVLLPIILVVSNVKSSGVFSMDLESHSDEKDGFQMGLTAFFPQFLNKTLYFLSFSVYQNLSML